jgi:hypothetical protein
VPEDTVTGKVPDRNAVIGKGDGKVYPKCGILTYEVLATCMAMAGGRPEYMPVAIAACETIITSQNTTLTSSMSAYPVTLVNGPIAREIRLSTGFGLLGPDPNRPAGSIIKRCLWFVHQGCGGLVSGGGTIAQFGYMRPGGVCFAENETDLPKGWKTYTEERFARSKGTNSVTYGLSSGGAIRDFTHRGSGSEPDHVTELIESFDRFASTIISTPTSGVPADAAGSTVMWLIPATTANDMANTALTDLGKSRGVTWNDKEGIKKQAAANLFYNVDDVRDRTGVIRSCTQKGIDAKTLTGRFKLCTDPQRIHLVVAGGDHPSRSCIIPSWGALGNVEIRKPKNWADLLAQAEKDLGPAPITD